MNLLATSPGPVCVCEFTGPLRLSQPTVSHHLKKLVEVGLLQREQRGIWAYYSSTATPLASLAAAVDLRGARRGRGTACCGPQAIEIDDNFGATLYAADERDALPAEAVAASLGCGNPTAVADLREGERVLDLGSGGGIDVLLSARRVGPTGKAYGLDMTEEMLALALANATKAGATNVEFLKGAIEAIPLPGEHGRRGDLQLRDQPVDRQAGGVRRDVPRARPRRPDRHLRRRRRRRPHPGAAGRAGRLRGLHRGALSFGEYREGLAAAGFTEVVEISPDPRGRRRPALGRRPGNQAGRHLIRAGHWTRADLILVGFGNATKYRAVRANQVPWELLDDYLARPPGLRPGPRAGRRSTATPR